MPGPALDDHQLKLEYETAHFLHSLWANDVSLVRYLEEKLSVRAVTRDGWIIFQGSPEACQNARLVLADLEETRRAGGEIEARDFRMAVDLFGEGTQTLSGLQRVQLRGGRGRKPVVARSPRQLEYLETMLANDVVFGLGPAGTGKTYLAMAMALSHLKEKKVSRVILTRPAVEAGEALGFLPGDLTEKVAPYLRPLYDAIDDILGYEEGQKLLEENIIEIAPLAYMRGRTLRRAYVILDEAQNTTAEQMFMALTRLGEESRMIVTGDLSQMDLKKNVPSGLAEATAALRGVEGIGFVTFDQTDVVRHPVVARIIAAYGRHREEK